MLDILIIVLCCNVEMGKVLIVDNLVVVLVMIKDVDLGGYFGINILVENNKVGIGCVY